MRAIFGEPGCEYLITVSDDPDLITWHPDVAFKVDAKGVYVELPVQLGPHPPNTIHTFQSHSWAPVPNSLYHLIVAGINARIETAMMTDLTKVLDSPGPMH